MKPGRALLAARLLCAPAVFLALGCTDTATVKPEASSQQGNVIVCGPGSYMGGAECIPVAAPECPSGTTHQNGQCVPVEAAQPVAEEAQAAPQQEPQME